MPPTANNPGSPAHDVRLVARVLGPFQRFFSTAAASGVVLLAFTATALLWANSPWAGAYHRVWETSFTAGVPIFGLTLSLHQWVNDGLMAVFFFLVGTEIKREVLVGELASRRSAALPVIAALGGMIVPALLYTAVNGGGPGAAGWGIPMATDIAFALGVLALLGDRVPSGLRVFLAALAIADDLGAVVVIALFYTSTLDWIALGAAALVLAVLVAVNRAGVQRALPYALLGIALWGCMLGSGVHATVAGVLLALAVPTRAGIGAKEQALKSAVAFGIMPVFALANAGVSLGSNVGASLGSPIAIGVALGLLVGKPLGITLASYLAVRSRVAELPAGVTWRQMHGTGWLGGIGFTMSLFIAGLAFVDRALLDTAKLGILAASIGAGVIGFGLLHQAPRTPKRD